MSYQVNNAIIMAAGLSSRFAPLSYEKPKALIEVKGEILIERQIRQLKEAGIKEIIIVVGYKKEQFAYLKEKFDVLIVENKDYLIRNNHSSIYAVKDYLKNSYICSADNYFAINPFEKEVDESYYAALYAPNQTNEWCLEEDKDGWITDVNIGGHHQWYMLGHTFWSEEFSKSFISILENIYDLPATKDKLWESIFIENLSLLKMKVRHYHDDEIYEFDSLDELRQFDTNYLDHTNSAIIKDITKILACSERDLYHFNPLKNSNGEVIGVKFIYHEDNYQYLYESKNLVNVNTMSAHRKDFEEIQEIIDKVFNKEKVFNITRMGGMTNRTYLVNTGHNQYMVRLPGFGTEELIRRSDEKISTELAFKLGLDAKLYYFDENTGIKVSEYISDAKTMSPTTMREPSNIVHVAKMFRKLHQCNVDTKVKFDIMDMAKTYEDFVIKNNGTLFDDYEEIKKQINQINNSYLTQVQKVPCHNDALCENWILKENKMYLIDWEYAGMNDKMWDLADVSIEASFNREMDQLLLENYFQHTPTPDEWKAFNINKVLIDYLWSLWGKTKTIHSGDEFEEYAQQRYSRMKENMDLLKH